jgi:hypothetical protein
MSSLSPKDRVSLCMFTFSDGRRCRTPRVRNHPHFCFDHAQKEARARATESLGKDLAYFFSGDYLSACDLSTALARLIPAVVRGDVKPRTARTVAYLAQTLLQTIHFSQHEYINAFGTDDWRKSIRNSVNDNHTYRYPPAPAPAQPQSQPPASQTAQTPVNCHSERSEESAFSSNSSLATHHSPLPQTPQPAPTPHTPLPPTSSEFAQHVVAGLPRSLRPGSAGKTGQGQAPQPAPTPQSAPGHTRSPIPTQGTPTSTPTAASGPSLFPHADRSEEPHPIRTTTTPAAQPNDPRPTASSTPKHNPPLDSRALHFDHNCRLLIDGKPF